MYSLVVGTYLPGICPCSALMEALPPMATNTPRCCETPMLGHRTANTELPMPASKWILQEEPVKLMST